jgi:hypothetical protein
MFGPSKQHLGGSEVRNGEEVKMAFGDWMQILEPDLFCVGICAKPGQMHQFFSSVTGTFLK